MDIEQEILKIKTRNEKVELEKAWEVSWTRKILIAFLTYLVAAAWLVVIRDFSPFLKALVPTAGYILSTISIPWVKKIWINRQ